MTVAEVALAVVLEELPLQAVELAASGSQCSHGEAVHRVSQSSAC